MEEVLFNYDEAQEYLNELRERDLKTRSLVSFTFSKLIFAAIAGEVPNSSFDMLYFIKVLEKALRCHDKLALMLDGDTLEWPDL
ncbi:hypothetical protein [uncultured Gimesia sp.]|jgi:hypothetical protein|uniref:hypothetical protein n=1 Tax=uncultured Gimesia sp. TaxID=1678688 RepID=UPI0026290151|nr:hypothetical protein [uncultured Gimesia sp.]